MQKKLIALAIAGLATAPAFAQSNVTIYGVADTTFENVKAGGATVSGADDGLRLNRNRVSANSSLLGFKGAEDLGNGLKAIFQFEGGVSSDTGLSSFAARDTFVGLTGNFGTVVLGNITHPIRAMGTKVDFNPGATGIGFAGSMYGEFNGLKTGTDSRASNAIAYVSPSFSGLTGTVAYVAGEARQASTATNPETKPQQWQIAGQYENGPIYAGIGYHEARDPLGTAVESKLKDFRVAGKYTFGFGLSLAGLWDRQKITTESFGLVDGTDVRRDAWHLGAAYDVGPHNVFLQYTQANKLKGGLCNDPTDPCADTKGRLWTVGYNYSLSKRTMIKTYYANLRNDKNALYDYYINPVGVTDAGAAGADPRGFGVGIRHVF